MSVNVGTIDRVLRGLLGLVLLYLALASDVALFQSPGWKIAAVVVGIVMLVVAVVRICPVYSLLGIRTCGVR
jgi:hypothetical protein